MISVSRPSEEIRANSIGSSGPSVCQSPAADSSPWSLQGCHTSDPQERMAIRTGQPAADTSDAKTRRDASSSGSHSGCHCTPHIGQETSTGSTASMIPSGALPVTRNASAILRIVGDREAAAALSNGALAHAEQFSWSATADRLLELYSGIIAG